VLLQDAGHTDFRDARGPLGFNQRQASGKFTRDEADAFIEQLNADQSDPSDQPDRSVRNAAQPARRLTATERAVRQLPTPQLAAELQRRGWIVVEP